MVRDVYPHWPEVDADTLAAIGRVVVAWGVLEWQISETIGDLYGLDGASTLAITANLGTKAKLELFMAGLDLHKTWLPGDVDIRDANRLATDTADASNKHRNLLAHGQPMVLDLGGAADNDEMFPSPKWVWTRTTARKGGVKIALHDFDRITFERSSVEINQLIDRWTQLRLDTEETTEALRYALNEMRRRSDESDR